MKEIIDITPQNLYFNCIYASVAHAVYVFKNPFFAYEQSWDGNNYSFQYGTARGTISFDAEADLIAGAARDDSSPRLSGYPEMNAASLFDEAPLPVKKLAVSETLQYLYDTKGGQKKPMATVSFWSEDNKIVLSDTMNDFSQNGGAFLLILTDSFENEKNFFLNEYEFNNEEIELVEMIYKSFLDGNKKIKLNRDWKYLLKGKEYSEGHISLAEIGIHLH